MHFRISKSGEVKNSITKLVTVVLISASAVFSACMVTWMRPTVRRRLRVGVEGGAREGEMDRFDVDLA